MEQLIRRVIDAVNARDFDSLDPGEFEPDFEFNSLFSQSEGTPRVGFEGLRRWAEDVDTVWDDFQVEIEAVEAAGPDRAVLSLRLTGRAKASGVPLDQRTGQIWTLRAGRLWRSVGYPSPGDARRAGGLESG